MASKGLTECWRAADAAKPSTWTIRGVVLGPREVDPAIRGERWAAWAVGPSGEKLSAEGDSPEDALQSLTIQLRGLSKYGTPSARSFRRGREWRTAPTNRRSDLPDPLAPD